MDFLEEYIVDLLHIEDTLNNNLLDLTGNNCDNNIRLEDKDGIIGLSARVLNLIKERIGKPANTILEKSALQVDAEQRIGYSFSSFSWTSFSNVSSPKQLNVFIESVYKELSYKGNNPLFLSVGALKWKTVVSGGDVKVITSPLLIFPIRLIRATVTSPVCIEFINDDSSLLSY